MAKDFNLAAKLGAGLERSIADEANYTKDRFTSDPQLRDFRALAQETDAARAGVDQPAPPSDVEQIANTTASNGAVSEQERETASKPRTKRVSQERAPKKARTNPNSPEKPRISYMLSDDDDEAINASMSRAYALNRRLSVSQVVRTAVRALAALSDDDFLEAVDGTPQVVRGRPIRGQR